MAGSGDAPPLVLASGSATRRSLLEAAGVPLAAIETPAVDEAAVRESLRADGADAARAAETLAELKAMRVARRHPGALVLGADQILETGDRGPSDWLEKPADRAAAEAQLRHLRGTTHRLVSVAVLVRDGTRIWHAADTARLTMRPFSDAFLACYLDAMGDAVSHSVGGYQLEGLGAHLFARVTGDVFTILGLPLLPLLEMLRAHGVVRA
nr:Maf family protein [Roseospira goensis]